MIYKKKMEVLLNKGANPLEFLLFAKDLDQHIYDLELWIKCLKLKVTEEDLLRAIDIGLPSETKTALDITDDEYCMLKKIASKRRMCNEGKIESKFKYN
ncbi:hypothetical protein [Aliikangiella maris]|uniref:DUF2857 family protein n=2 Tax=Aliikangiella maris TaxID=3162458 RepID=A0ABV3MKL7_9GAMM